MVRTTGCVCDKHPAGVPSTTVIYTCHSQSVQGENIAVGSHQGNGSSAEVYLLPIS